MFDLLRIWERLENEDAYKNGYARLRVEPKACCDIFIGLRKPDNERCMILEVEEGAIRHGTRYPRSNSFDVFPLRIPSEGKVRITLLLNDNRYSDIFSALLIDQVKNILLKNEQREAVDDFVARLFRWQMFFLNNPEGLSEESQKGLYGELWFIRDFLIPRLGTLNALKSWVGPEKANQDFQLSGKAIEIKSSSGINGTVRISNKRQLDQTGFSQLYLVHFTLDIHADRDNTLPELIDEIRSILDQQSSILFEDKLMEYGYLEVHRDRYGYSKYSLRNVQFYEVRDGFPRITEQNIMQGIKEVSYSISMDACLPYVVSPDNLFRNIEEGR